MNTEVDRLVIHAFFNPADRWQGSTELIRFANTLNQKYNAACFYVDNDGDLAVRTSLTFVDSVSWKEVEQFLEHLDTSLLVIFVAEATSMAKYLR
jgi:hypothetical protein